MSQVPPGTFARLQAEQFEKFYETSTPRAMVNINGRFYVPVSYDIEYNAHGATDSAKITLPISSNPDFSVELARDEKTANQPVYVQIFAGFPQNPNPGATPSNQLQLRFFGIVDVPSAMFESDEVMFQCRSLAAPLVDLPLTTLSMNQTSVEFVTQQAQSIGLTPNIVLPKGYNPVTIQEVFAREFIGGVKIATSVYNLKPWDIMLKCAQFDDVDVWVTNDTLNYAAPGLIQRKTVDCKYGRDLKSLKGDHSIQFAKNVRVKVLTYQPRIKQSTTIQVDTGDDGGIAVTGSTKTVISSPIFGTTGQTTTNISESGTTQTTASTTGGAFSSGFTSPGSESGKETYIIPIYNVSPQRANLLAQAKWRQISMHEYRVEFEMPVTKAKFGVVDITALFRVHGVPYQKFNDTYWPRRISEIFDPKDHEHGWHWIIEAVNHTLPQGAV